jgi:uncharacterized protein (TIGR03435 family)
MSDSIRRGWSGKRLQQLLAERFQLKVHHTLREIPGYLLTVAKGGTKGFEADENSTPSMSFADGKLEARAATMDQLAYMLAQRVLQSPVTNTTGLAGKFDLKLKLDPAQTRAAAAADTTTDNGPSIFVALQQQLGLRLEPHKTQADAVVIDSAEMPQEN